MIDGLSFWLGVVVATVLYIGLTVAAHHYFKDKS